MAKKELENPCPWLPAQSLRKISGGKIYLSCGQDILLNLHAV